MNSSPNDRLSSFASALRVGREARGWSQTRLALEMSIQQSVYSKWESGKLRVPRRHVERLRQALNLPDGIVADYLSEADRVRDYLSLSYANLRRSGVSDGELFAAVAEIVDEFPPATVPSPDQGSNDFGEESKWQQFIREFPECFRVIHRVEPKEYVAYWHVASIDEDIYDRGRAGENINLELQGAHLREFITPGNHCLYFIDLFRKPLHNNPAANREILESFLAFLRDLSTSGHYVDRILAHASTPEAERICSELSFSFICNHRFHRRYLQTGSAQLVPTKIYELNLSRDFRRLMAMSPDLLGRYMTHFGVT